MPFPKFEIAKYPPRQWAAAGFPGSGKSTFLAAMNGPFLVIDADQRFDQTLRELKEHGIAVDAHRLSTNKEDNTDPLRIAKLLDANMPGAKIGTISVDSLTTIIAPRVTRAMLAKSEGEIKNQMAGFTDKALAMRMLQDSVTKWGTDVLWVWHLSQGRDEGARVVVNETLSKTERARLFRSINLRIHFVEEKDQRGVKVVWARTGRSGMTLWDAPGNFWRGMPERIEQEVYDGLSLEERAALEKEPPERFPDEASAINWGFEQGPFNAVEHARNAWDKLKRESGFDDLADLSPLWVAEVERRLQSEIIPGEAGRAEQGSGGRSAGAQGSGGETEPHPNGKPNGKTNGKAAYGPTQFWTWCNENKILRERALKVLEEMGGAYDQAQARLAKGLAKPQSKMQF